MEEAENQFYEDEHRNFEKKRFRKIIRRLRLDSFKCVGDSFRDWDECGSPAAICRALDSSHFPNWSQTGPDGSHRCSRLFSTYPSCSHCISVTFLGMSLMNPGFMLGLLPPQCLSYESFLCSHHIIPRSIGMERPIPSLNHFQTTRRSRKAIVPFDHRSRQHPRPGTRFVRPQWCSSRLVA